MPQNESFEPHKRTLGELLASTSPPLRVPDFQRDYSWGKEQFTEFWEDIVAFAGAPKTQPARDYFLGATVLANSGKYHLVLDGQQRLATATILLAVIRTKMREYSDKAAQQIQDQFIVYTDQITGETISRLELNKFDRMFFREFIQTFPPAAQPEPKQKSHYLIASACAFFTEKVQKVWDEAGGGKAGFDRIGHISLILRNHVVVIAAVSTSERGAASIFTTLNDRGIGLSSVDLVRSYILQNAHESQQQEILDAWEATFVACGRDIGTETLMRMSWVARHGDLKTRALYKVIADSVDNASHATAALDYSRTLKNDALLYRKIREGDTDDPDLEECWLSLRTLKFNAGYPLMISAANHLGIDDQRRIATALRSLVVRRNFVCNLDRAPLESLAFGCAKLANNGSSAETVVDQLRSISPSNKTFSDAFRTLSFSAGEHGVARYLLELFNRELAPTGEIDVAGSLRVHVEHIYPQNPKVGEKWEEHRKYVLRLGNLTLLDKRLNEQIKNSAFPIKKPYYEESQLAVTRALLAQDDWSPAKVEERQDELLKLAEKLWPESLVP